MEKKKTYYLIGAIALVVVVGGALLLNQSSLFQGKFMPFKFGFMNPAITEQIYKYKNKAVTPVASPVTSVVASDVTSPGGTSQVPSAVTSAVASAVAVDKSKTPKNINDLPSLTRDVLINAAKKDMQNNLRKYTLPKAEKDRIIRMYKSSQKI